MLPVSAIMVQELSEPPETTSSVPAWTGTRSSKHGSLTAVSLRSPLMGLRLTFSSRLGLPASEDSDFSAKKSKAKHFARQQQPFSRQPIPWPKHTRLPSDRCTDHMNSTSGISPVAIPIFNARNFIVSLVGNNLSLPRTPSLPRHNSCNNIA